MTKRVSIIGCGVAGPALALFLRRIGVDATIYEASPTTDNSGSFLNLASNGIAVLNILGLAEQMVAAGFSCPRMVMWSGNGKKLGELNNGATPEHGMPSVIIKRSDVHRILREEALRQGITIEYGHVLRQVDDHNEGVRAIFEDGSTAEGDFVVGCDGVHSRVRHSIDPAAPAPTYTGLISCGGYATTDLAPTTGTQHFVFGKRAFFGYLVKPNGEAMWFNNHAFPGQPRRSELERITQDEWRRRLLELHADDQPFITQMIRATTSRIGTYPIYDMPPVSRWQHGRCVMLGDAAHATSPSGGQGASMALEDAIVLAQCIRDVRRTDEAFATFERLRKERAEQVVKFSRTSGSNKVASNVVTRSIRDLVLPFVLKRFANTASLDWLYGYHIDWSTNVAG